MAKLLQAAPKAQNYNIGQLDGFQVGKARSTDGALGVKVKIKGLYGSPDFSTYLTVQPEWCPKIFNPASLDRRESFAYSREIGGVDRPGTLVGVAGSNDRAVEYLDALGEMSEHTPEELCYVLQSVFERGADDPEKAPLPFLYVTRQQRKSLQDDDGEWTIKERGQYMEVMFYRHIPTDEKGIKRTFESFLKSANKQATKFAAGEIDKYGLEEDDAKVTFDVDKIF